jgi:hypothetical protein
VMKPKINASRKPIASISSKLKLCNYDSPIGRLYILFGQLSGPSTIQYPAYYKSHPRFDAR